jgi:hypothetical protein
MMKGLKDRIRHIVAIPAEQVANHHLLAVHKQDKVTTSADTSFREMELGAWS